MGLTDSCPSCLRRGIRPSAARASGDATVFGYRCPGCRHCWTTSRLRAAYPAPDERRSAA